MGIPGLQAEVEPRGKVRVGEKRSTGAASAERPSGLDYFVSDDGEFQERYPGQPRELQIRLAGETKDECWRTGLEWWGRKEGASGTLVCFSKGEQMGESVVALRLNGQVDEDDRKLGPEGDKRTPIACRFRECPRFKPNGCRPMGRLDFFLDGGREIQPLRFETKGFNTIEAIEGALRLLRGHDLSSIPFTLGVRFETRGDKRFPFVWLARRDVEAAPSTEPTAREQLIAAIRSRGADPKDEVVVKWVQELGVDAALEALRG